jgi:hypothetical protein
LFNQQRQPLPWLGILPEKTSFINLTVSAGLNLVVTMKPRILGLTLFAKSHTATESLPRLFATAKESP